MADFKISRLKYNWRGPWVTGTVYNPDDVISIGSKVYTCLVRHTASVVFYTDLNYVNNDVPPLPVPKWELTADGASLRGNWTGSTEYFVGDIVKFGAILYICLTGHTSVGNQALFDTDVAAGNWTIFVSGTDWVSNWTPNTFYSVGDVVKLSANLYICNTDHTSSATADPGLYDDTAKWDAFQVGENWRGAWSTSTIYYPNDLAKYGGNIYKCITGHTSTITTANGLENDTANWALFYEGVEYKGPLAASTRYKLNDVVQYGSYLYQCTTYHTTADPAVFNIAYWQTYCPGLEYSSTWNSASAYQPGDIVRHGGYLCVSLTTNLNSEPSFDEDQSLNVDWQLLFQGTKVRGEWSSTTEYFIGDLVRQNGYLYTAKTNPALGSDVDVIGDGSTVNSIDWELFLPGVYWRSVWDSDQRYNVGDLVSFRGAGYRCIQKHDSEPANQPDVGLGSYWIQYTYGDPTNVLTNLGDIKKFNTVATSNIAIGTRGQTLKVVNGQPEWNYFNLSADVYFVSPDGVDEPAGGTTLNSAWRTIRYALDSITGPATLLVKAGLYREILPITIPPNVAVVGDELRSSIVEPADGYFSLTDIDRYEDIVDFIISVTANVMSNVTITEPLGHVVQNTTGPVATGTDITDAITNLTTIKSLMTSTVAPIVVSSNTESSNSGAQQFENNKEFIQSEVLGYLDLNFPSYDYNINEINSSVNRIIGAVVYDLTHTGNYKSVRTGQFFYNGRNFSANKLQNMFLMRDACGLRNMSLKGLDGELGAFNIYLTRRPTAGAYASLDPGWGPADTSIWITGRSPYVQNVSTFGHACAGLKVDGTLHSGGYKTIVANDFTQILSDGIGVWCNGDGKTEVVSVFTYYNHVGYLCTDGGKIRGTNGNCSYGQYGAAAESFDLTETPISATVNNRYYDATAGEVFTNGSNLLRIFYSNAGQNYTTATTTISGAGINATVVNDEFRDGSVFECRLANLNDSTAPGGSGYTSAANNAQGGNEYSITLAASFDELASDFQRLRIVIPTGTGVGQYGILVNYDNSSKIALVGDERQNTISITNTTTGADTLTFGSLGTETDHGLDYKVGDFVTFTGTLFGGVVNNTVYKIASVLASPERITITDTADVPVTLSTASGSMVMHILGWNHFSPGYAIESVLDTTTYYNIEPRVYFSNPTNSSTTGNLVSGLQWSSIAYGQNRFVAIARQSDTTAYSTDGTNWQFSSLPSSSLWTKVAYGNGRYVAVSSSGIAATSTDGISWASLTVPSLTYSDVAYGDGVWIAISTGGNQAARSTNGTTWASLSLPEGADWSGIAFGKGKFVAVAQSDSNLCDTVYSSDLGVTWNTGSFVGGCKSIAFGNNRFVAVSGGYAGAEDSFISFDGINWLSGRIPTANWQSVTYGQGLFFAVNNDQSFAAKSTDGRRWELVTPVTTDDYSGIAFGGTNGDKKFVTVARLNSNSLNFTLGLRAQGRIVLNAGRVTELLLFETGRGHTSAPTVTLIDPNNSADAALIPRIANGVLGNPTITNVGEGYPTISTRATISGDGFTDLFQIGRYLVVEGAVRIPGPGDNLRITGVTDYVYKIVDAVVLNGGPGNYTIKLTIAKSLEANESPDHGTSVTIRQNYSQVRLTGHDFLDIGLGNFVQTNYPNTLFPVGTVLAPEDEIRENNGGRVFYTSSDQDGNFRVGELFAVEQASGTVTISAEFFELEGLEELRLGGVSVGGSGVVIREFSTDSFFTADSNNIISTQKAIKTYLARRISGGGSDAFTTIFTAGIVRVGPNLITTTTLEKFEFPGVVRFKYPISGQMLAKTYFSANNDIDDGYSA